MSVNDCSRGNKDFCEERINEPEPILNDELRMTNYEWG